MGLFGFKKKNKKEAMAEKPKADLAAPESKKTRKQENIKASR
ncbi:MAG: hypothetical protein ABIJ91_04805 [Candidatus Kuenenbacteria bacterium]